MGLWFWHTASLYHIVARTQEAGSFSLVLFILIGRNSAHQSSLCLSTTAFGKRRQIPYAAGLNGPVFGLKHSQVAQVGPGMLFSLSEARNHDTVIPE
jgi:hypothetical protein